MAGDGNWLIVSAFVCFLSCWGMGIGDEDVLFIVLSLFFFYRGEINGWFSVFGGVENGG